MGVYAAGNTYGIPEDLIYSFPIQIKVSPSNRLVNMTNTCTKPDSSNVESKMCSGRFLLSSQLTSDMKREAPETW